MLRLPIRRSLTALAAFTTWCAVSFAGAPPASAAVDFTNEGNKTGWNRVSCPGDRGTVTGSPTRSGAQALRFEAVWGDPDGGGRYHCEAEKDGVSAKFQEAWAGFSVYIPKPSGNYVNEGTVMQWKTNCCGGREPILMIQTLEYGRFQAKIFYGELKPEGNSSVIEDLGTFSYGQWVDFVVYEKFRADGQGRLKIWKNDALVLDFTGRTTYGGDHGIDFRAGMYAGQWSHEPPPQGARSVGYVDSVRLGDGTSSKAEVAPR